MPARGWLLLLAAAFFGASQASETIEHLVRPGETLWSIAAQERIYGDPYLWPVIYKFNRDQIKDPARIYPGQRLQIPVQLDARARLLINPRRSVERKRSLGGTSPQQVHQAITRWRQRLRRA